MEGGYTAGSKAMGGLSVGLRDGMITNPSNPASYTAVDSITFILTLGYRANTICSKREAIMMVAI